MKHLLLIIFIFCAGITWGQELDTELWDYRNYEKVEKKCEICGKSIYKNEEVKSFNQWLMPQYGGMGYGWYGEDIPDSLRCQHILFERELLVCPACTKLYGQMFLKGLESVWNELLERVIKQNVDKCKFHEELRKQKKIENIERQIEKLKLKRKGIKEGKNYSDWDLENMIRGEDNSDISDYEDGIIDYKDANITAETDSLSFTTWGEGEWMNDPRIVDAILKALMATARGDSIPIIEVEQNKK